MPRVNEKQKAFARNHVAGMSAAEAARTAGYKNAGRQAYQLLEKPHIQAYIAELRAQAETEAVLTLTELQEWWSSLVRGETVRLSIGEPEAGLSVETIPDLKERIKASDLLGKSMGAFTEKREHSGGVRIEVVYVDADDD